MVRATSRDAPPPPKEKSAITDTKQQLLRYQLEIRTAYISDCFSSETITSETIHINENQLADSVWGSIGSEKIQLMFNGDQQKSSPIITQLREYVLRQCNKVVESKWYTPIDPLTYEIRIVGTHIKISVDISLITPPV